jgi:S-adenosylmethionine decarboxylase
MPGGFEGPEKRFELDFRASTTTPLEGLRSITREKWQEMLDLARCTILNTTSNDHFDAFVLSESSLFVYPHRILIKTCGTTTLLNCVNKMLDYANECNLSIEFVRYSRKNFLFPHEQKYPHTAWEDEVTYLKDIFGRGEGMVMGSQSDEKWYLYLADFSDSPGLPKVKPHQIKTIEIMMHNLEEDAAEQFIRKPGTGDQDKHPAMKKILNEDVVTDEFNFTPCGYSMNALDEEAYHTVHVTPESHCSYASYETNARVRSYTKLITHVFDVFKPGTAQLALFTERSNLVRDSNTIEKETSPDFTIPGYDILFRVSKSLDANCDVVLLNYASHTFSNSPKSIKKLKQSHVHLENLS